MKSVVAGANNKSLQPLAAQVQLMAETDFDFVESLYLSAIKVYCEGAHKACEKVAAAIRALP